MNPEHQAFRHEFESLRSICEDNPSLLLGDTAALRGNYKYLEDQHFQFMQAYAHTKFMHFHEALGCIENILSKAVSTNDLFIVIHCYLLLARCHHKDLEKQQSCLKMAEDFARKSGDSIALAETLSAQGDFLLANKKYSAAEERHLLVQKLLEKEDSPARKIRSLISLANINRDLQHPAKAISYLRNALEICRANEFEKQELIILNRLAMILIDQEHYQDAEELLLKAIELCTALELTVQKIQAIFSLGTMYLKMQHVDAAYERFVESAVSADKSGFDNPLFMLDLQYNLGEIHFLKANLVEATACFDRALRIAREHNVKDAEHEVVLAKARILIIQKQYEEAEKLLKLSIKATPNELNSNLIDEAWEALAKLYHRMKDYPKCVQTLQKHVALLQKTIKKLSTERCESIPDKIELNFSRFCAETHKDVQELDNYGFVGGSEAHRGVLDAALLAAQYPNVNVVLMGESGTGKEVIANIIHQNSLRRYHAFVPFNAAAISTHLVESELFGHIKGSFTGAVCDNKGFFQRANKGTLFIDEITEMPLEIQAKLLRAIESKKINPVGSNAETAIDCRIITATNLNIYDLIKTNSFRLDLFHRINTIEIYIPPLRERVEDIPILLAYFIKQFSKELNKAQPILKPSFVHCLQSYDFPGNVRELKNLVERLFILAKTDTWDEQLLLNLCSIIPRSKQNGNAPNITLENEEEQIKQALIQCNGIQKDAAKQLQISNSTLTRRVIKYNLEAFTRKGSCT